MRTFLRGKVLLFMTFALVLAVPAIALADNFQNTLAASETGTRTITTDGTTAGSTTVGYRVIGNSAAGDPQSGCNVTDGSALNVSFNVANVTASPSPLSFTSCGTTQNTTFSSTTPGTYIIDPALSDAGTGTYQDQSAFTLHVKGTGTSVTNVSGSGTEGLSDGSLSAKLVWNNNNVGGKTVSFAIDKQKNGTFETVGSATTDNTTGVATLNNVSLAGLAPGTYDLKATFAGDNNYAGDDTTGTLTVNSANTEPVLTVPSTITAEATSSAGAAVTFTGLSATDDEDGDLTSEIQCTPASGSTFDIGNTTVNCSVEDSGGLTDSGSFTVTVVDTTPPKLTLPADITEEATGPSGAAVSFNASASDLVDGSITPNCDAASGDTFALGTTTVTCSATDAAGNEATGSFKVTVVDTTPPKLTLPANITEEATGPNGNAVTFTATASDLVDGTVAVTCDPASGSTFAISTTTVDCSATDAAGNEATGSFTVKVQDTIAPSNFQFVGNINDGDSFYFGNVPASPTCTATDGGSGLNSAGCVVSGHSNLVGTHKLTATATDKSGNTATKEITYTVKAWTTKGFYQPVDMGGVVNTVKGGSTVPLKFELFAGTTELTDTSAIKFTATKTDCAPGATEDAIEVTATGGTSLRYDSTGGQFIYNWKTPTGAGCYTVTMTANDGSKITAYFKSLK
jgi:hypothetical protein